jgi:hypothetical protein
MAKKKAPKKSTKAPVKSKGKAPAKAARKPLKTKKVAKATPKKKAKAAPKRAVKKVAKKAAPKKAAPKAKATRKAPVKTAKAKVTKKTRTKVVKKPVAPPPPVRLQRERRRLPEVEAEGAAFTGTSGDARLLRSAKSGHDELQSELKQHTESSPELTAGDVDAKWQDAYALGDEAPGGDNMTPDQDRVDDIGKALGIEYDDDEELQGGGELAARDEHRWELDPESKEDEDE